MEIYRVGGSVRDELLGVAVADQDYVVVGATAEELLEQGFKPVGRDFPVFLHPDTGDEYALARTERKTAPGYRGFELHADPTVTLEQDLQRRDLTINAIARAADGTLIDPFGGQADLEAKRLRHISDAFAEDPVRILRVARFMARWADRGFAVDEETLALMRSMVDAGEVDHLVPERVWTEMDRALGEARPDAFVTTLRACGALARLLPELERLFGVPQVKTHHPEVDTGEHVLRVLRAAAAEQAPSRVVFACLVHDLGKGLTPADELPAHRGHEQRGVEPVRTVCERLRVPKATRDLALRVCRHHLEAHRAFELRPATVLRLIEAVDGLRRPQGLEDFLAACRADRRGRAGREDDPYPEADFLRAARAAADAVDTAPLRAAGHEGPALGEALRQARIEAIRALRRPSR